MLNVPIGNISSVFSRVKFFCPDREYLDAEGFLVTGRYWLPNDGRYRKQRNRSIKVPSPIFDVRVQGRHTPIRRQVLGLIYETQPSSHH